jgi:hypothetical protein
MRLRARRLQENSFPKFGFCAAALSRLQQRQSEIVSGRCERCSWTMVNFPPFATEPPLHIKAVIITHRQQEGSLFRVLHNGGQDDMKITFIASGILRVLIFRERPRPVWQEISGVGQKRLRIHLARPCRQVGFSSGCSFFYS